MTNSKKSGYKYYFENLWKNLRQKDEVSCYLPVFSEENYYELQLAEPAPAIDSNNHYERTLLDQHYFPINISDEEKRWHKPLNAAQRLRSIVNHQAYAVHIILSESGGGKTTLLSKWAHDTYADYCEDNSKAFPIYIRLRALGNPDNKNAALADYYKGLTSENINIQPFLDRQKKALWLFDGWDELAEEAKQDWISYIYSLAGQKIVSCRMLRYQHDFSAAHHYLIYGLSKKQQKEYLQKILPSFTKEAHKYPKHGAADSTWIDTLLQKLSSQANSRLHQPAISPLLLRLIAETNPPNNIRLPNTRTEFYDIAISNMLKREARLREIGKVTERSLKKALGEIAYHAQLDFNFSGDVLADGLESICGDNEDKACELERNLIKCGILREVGKDSYEFLHATFHEWALAHYLAQQESPLVNAVQAYWCDPRYDEVIALLWTHNKINDAQREAATRFLIEVGYKPQRENARRWRGGLKQSIVFWDLAGMQMPDSLAENIWGKLRNNFELERALCIMKTKQNFFMRKLAGSKYEDIRLNILENPNLPVDVMQTFAKDEDDYFRSSLARNPNLSIEVMHILAKDEYESVRDDVAENPNLPVEVMHTLAKDEYKYFRWNLASNPNLPIEVMHILAKDEDEGVRSSLVRNPNLPIALVQTLAKDEYKDVRGGLARNPNLPIKVMHTLTKDEDEYVRSSLARNPNLPIDVMRILAKDEGIRSVLAYNPNIPIDVMKILAKGENESIRGLIAGNPNLPIDVVQTLAKDGDEYVRNRLAGNPNLPIEVMQTLAKDEEKFVRANLASNSNIPIDLIRTLVKDESTSVRRCLAKNLNIPINVMQTLAKDEDEYIRWDLAENPNLSIDVIRTLAKDKSRVVIRGLVGHRNFPWEILLD